jgi:hypothetical protein
VSSSKRSFDCEASREDGSSFDLAEQGLEARKKIVKSFNTSQLVISNPATHPGK